MPWSDARRGKGDRAPPARGEDHDGEPAQLGRGAHKTISEILGHSQVQITQQAHIHTDTARHAEALRSLGALLAAPDAGE